MELKQLEYFQMVGHLNNVTRAAEKLHVSQPSITTAIQRLEQELGVALFDRSKKQMSLTIEGRVFLERVEAILKGIEDAVVEMNDYKHFRKGTLRIGIPPMIGTYLFPHIFVHFKKDYPQIELNISENGSLTTKNMIEKGDLDLGIVIISETSEKLNTLPISKSRILVCVNENHPLGRKAEITLDNLSDESIIMLKEGFYHREKLMEHFKKCNITPRIILSSNQLETIKSLVINGVGISFLLEEVVANDKRILGIPLKDPLDVTIGLAWKKDRYLSKASETFIDFITNAFISTIK